MYGFSSPYIGGGGVWVYFSRSFMRDKFFFLLTSPDSGGKLRVERGIILRAICDRPVSKLVSQDTICIYKFLLESLKYLY